MLKVSKMMSGDRPAYWLIIIAIALRSMIAPGYMLSVNDVGLAGIGITLCEGLNGSIQSAATDDPHAAHSINLDDQHEDGYDLTLTGCGLWSTSSLYGQVISLYAGNLLEPGPDQFHDDHYSVIDNQTTRSTQQPRAPPAPLFV